MELKIQIISIVFSILYGSLFGILYNLNYKFLYKTSLRYKILNNFLFSIDIFLIYFIIMLKINNGDIKMLFIILTFISFALIVHSTKNFRKIVKCLKIKKKNKSLLKKV